MNFGDINILHTKLMDEYIHPTFKICHGFSENSTRTSVRTNQIYL